MHSINFTIVSKYLHFTIQRFDLNNLAIADISNIAWEIIARPIYCNTCTNTERIMRWGMHMPNITFYVSPIIPISFVLETNNYSKI